ARRRDRRRARAEPLPGDRPAAHPRRLPPRRRARRPRRARRRGRLPLPGRGHRRRPRRAPVDPPRLRGLRRAARLQCLLPLVWLRGRGRRGGARLRRGRPRRERGRDERRDDQPDRDPGPGRALPRADRRVRRGGRDHAGDRAGGDRRRGDARRLRGARAGEAAVSAGEAVLLVSRASRPLGARLTASLPASGPRIRARTRHPGRAPAALAARAELVGWDGQSAPAEALAGADAVLHLAGEPLFGGLATPGRLRRIRSSRVDSTRGLVAAIQELPAAQRPRALVCASAVGIYGSRGEEELGERAPAGEGFAADLCRDWETAALAAAAYGVRVVTLRFGVVLAREGGALALL